MQEIKFKRGDIIQHQDGSLYVVKEDDAVRGSLQIGTIVETTNAPPPEDLMRSHVNRCVKVGHVND